jgi:hypothetical protein
MAKKDANAAQSPSLTGRAPETDNKMATTEESVEISNSVQLGNSAEEIHRETP